MWGSWCQKRAKKSAHQPTKVSLFHRGQCPVQFRHKPAARRERCRWQTRCYRWWGERTADKITRGLVACRSKVSSARIPRGHHGCPCPTRDGSSDTRAPTTWGPSAPSCRSWPARDIPPKHASLTISPPIRARQNPWFCWSSSTLVRSQHSPGPTTRAYVRVSIFARHGATGFRPRWSTSKGGALLTPAAKTDDGPRYVRLVSRFHRRLLWGLMRPLSPETGTGDDHNRSAMCQPVQACRSDQGIAGRKLTAQVSDEFFCLALCQERLKKPAD